MAKINIEINKIQLINNFYINKNYEKLDNFLNYHIKKLSKENIINISNNNIYTFHKYLSNIIINKKDIKNISINFILYLFNFNNSIDFNNIDKYYKNKK